MKRFLVALAVLLGFYGLARADYVIIIYNLGAVREAPAAGGGMPGMPGGAFGALGAGGGSPSTPPGGMAGMGGMGGGRGGFVSPGGAAGMGGGSPSTPGGAGGGPAPGGIGGTGLTGGPAPGGIGGTGLTGGPAPGGMGGTGLTGGPTPGGFAGMSGGPRPGGMGGMSGMPPPGGGANGWQPPGGFGGGMPPPGGMGMGGMGGFLGAGNVPEQNFTPLLVMAVVEVEKWTKYEIIPGQTTNIIKASNKWAPSGSYILPMSPDKRLTAEIHKWPSIHKLYKDEYAAAHPNNGKGTVLGLSRLAEWALQHDLLDEFVKVMGELGDLDPKDNTVVAFKQVQEAMAKEITKGDASDVWKAKVLSDDYKVEKSAHYALLHNLDAVKPAEVESRLKRLEANYRAFFYWFALKGKVMPVPEQRLVAVLVKRGDEFKRQQQIFDALPTVADGFLARRDNLAVFSLERTDLASEALKRNTKSIWEKLATDRDTSLRTWPMVFVVTNEKKVMKEKLEFAQLNKATRQVEFPVAEIQTIALLERALQEDAEIAAVTHEGTRQLLAATGLLPRNVAVPEWLQFGWAAFFETPKGSPWMTVGTPSSTLLPEFNYLAQYKEADKAGKLKDRTKAFIDVITDADFREFAKNPQSEEARVKARTMAWSVTFFLANSQHLDGLKRYHEELKKLPRDLEFDAQTLLLTFARAFDCLDASNPNAVNRSKLDKLATEWHDYISQRPGEAEALLTELANKQAELKAQHGPKPGGDAPPK